MTPIGKYITLEKFCHSDNAARKKMDNMATDPVHLQNIRNLIEHVFDPLCKHFGVVIYISSGYRSRALNLITKGASLTSAHAKGQAVDLDQDGQGTPTNRQIFDYIKANLPFDQLIWEFGDDNNPSWVHVSFKMLGNRRQILRAVPHPDNSRNTKYLPWG